MKNAYPPFGGDPSAPSVIAFNELNFTASETNLDVVFATGKDDYRKVYQYQEIYGYNYLVNNYTWFDGNQTKWEWRSPWAEKDYFYGTSAKIFAPYQFEANNMSLLITQVQRYGSNSFYDDTVKTERYGIDLYKSFLNKYIGEVAPHNDKYYQTIPNVFNVSSIYGLPLYVTKNHFMNCTDWLEKVDIFNEDKSIQYKSISQWDDTFILVEVPLPLFSPTLASASSPSSISRITTSTSLTNFTPTLSTPSSPSSPSLGAATSQKASSTNSTTHLLWLSMPRVQW